MRKLLLFILLLMAGRTDASELAYLKLPGDSNSSALANVKILADSFWMPQLNRYRRIWIYLPSDYQTSTKKYPVLYMHDGQNLFDSLTSSSGEWRVDENLVNLEKTGDKGCIVVGIENGVSKRIDELSPFIDTSYGGGECEAYTDFIVYSLKPYIDSAYRTNPDRIHTGLGGSSLGGLATLYGVLAHPNIFSKAAIFSPSFWFSHDSLFFYVQGLTAAQQIKFYFVSGATESTDMVTDMQAMYDVLGAIVGHNDRKILVQPDGKHKEWFWAREFPAAYQWLFGDITGVDDNKVNSLENDISIYPNPTADWVKVSFINKSASMSSIKLMDLSGRELNVPMSTEANGVCKINTENLCPGVFFIHLVIDGKENITKLVKL